MPTPANALNISSAGLVKFNGTSAFTAETTTQFDVLVGAASNGISSISPSTAGFILTSNGVGSNPSFQIPAVTGSLTYYFTNTASDVAGELQQTSTTFTPKTTQPFAALGSGDTLLETFITNAGNPGLSFLPAGTYEMHLHANQTLGTRSMTLHAEIWEATTLGADIAKIGTTGVTAALTASETEYFVDFSLGSSYTFASTASRIKTKIFATGGGTGSNATVNIFVGDTADSHLTLPGPIADVTNFVPYTGAVKAVNLGPNSITALSATLTNPLTVPNGGSGAASFNINGPVISSTTTTGNLASITLLNQQFLVGNTSAAPTAKAFSVVNQVFTSTGTYTPTAGMLYCLIQCVGGGGAGGGTAATAGNQFSMGAGGGSGEYATGIFSASSIGASKSVTIGDAGTANSGAAGGNGGTTSVGSTLISANGGNGGNTTGAFTNSSSVLTAGGTGGSGGTGGDYRFAGTYGLNSLSAGGFAQGGGGGANSPLGSGGAPKYSQSAGTAGAGYGSGGGGAYSLSSQGAQSGGAGGKGVVIITEYVLA